MGDVTGDLIGSARTDGSVPFGIPGLEIAPGDHLCAFYRGDDERDEMLQAFLGAGLQRGDACYAIIDETPLEDIESLFAGVPDPHPDSSLTVTPTLAAHLRSGAFDPNDMLSFWDETVTDTLSTGPDRFFRAAAEMTWSLREMPGVQQLAEFESRLNDFLPRYNQTILCMYDLTKFSGDVVIDMLKTHPKAFLGGMLFENPYYLTPEEFLASRN